VCAFSPTARKISGLSLTVTPSPEEIDQMGRFPTGLPKQWHKKVTSAKHHAQFIKRLGRQQVPKNTPAWKARVVEEILALDLRVKENYEEFYRLSRRKNKGDYPVRRFSELYRV
jgi:hypothetical protein